MQCENLQLGRDGNDESAGKGHEEIGSPWPDEKSKAFFEKKPENRVGKKRSRVVS